MVQYYLGFPNLDGPYWTLIIELCFYFFMIVMMLTKQLKRIMLIGLAFAVFCASYSLPWVYENMWLKKILIGFPLIGYFPFFYGGMVLYQMKFEKVTFLRLVTFVSTFIFQCLMFTHCYENRNFVKLYQYVPALTFIYAVFLFFLFGKLRFIVNPATMWLGRISYSLYLIHQYLGIRILIPQFIEKFRINFWLAAPIALFIVLVVAYCINRFIEVPAMRYLKSIIPAKKEVVEKLS
jgi:peptidoglycan/LPS O-acetylase OafA/YrhL